MKLKLILLGLFFTQAASAHTFGALNAGLAEGFVHPFLGLDHLLAMLAVGLWSVQSGRRYWLPVSFITIMSASACIGAQGFDLPFLEPAIASSVLILGLLIAFAIRLSALSSFGLIALFAFFHGFAHGLELNQTHSAMLYGLGFISATGLLHAAGIFLGERFIQKSLISKSCGFIIAASGIYILALV